MRTLIAVASLAVLAVACSRDPDSSTDSSGVTPQNGAAQAPTPAAPAAPPPAPASNGEQGGVSDWKQVASAADAANLGRLDQAWRLARAEAEDKGFAAQVEALGPLVDPNAGLAGRLQPAPGTYRCRTIRLGTKNETGLAFNAYPFFTCTVELTPGGDLILTRTTGSQRTRGLLYPDTDRRLVFIGAQAWGVDETTWPRYGEKPVRDQVGVFERIGTDHWRMVAPFPRVESRLEILDLVK